MLASRGPYLSNDVFGEFPSSGALETVEAVKSTIEMWGNFEWPPRGGRVERLAEQAWFHLELIYMPHRKDDIYARTEATYMLI